MRETVLPALLIAALVALLLSLMLLLSSCYLFIGAPPDLLPLPDNATVMDLPQILDCSTLTILTRCEDISDRVCGWYFWTEPGVQTPSTGWIYTCRNIRIGTDCLYDITIRLTVLDHSDDLDPGKLPRIRVFDSDPVATNLPLRHCFLDIPQTDIIVHSTDVEGGGATRIVTVRLKDVRARFTDSCNSFSASLRFAIVFEADDEDLLSTNSCQAVVECNRPNTVTLYPDPYANLPQLIGPFSERPDSW